MKDPSVLLLGRKGDAHCEEAIRCCQAQFPSTSAVSGLWGDPLPDRALEWSGDLIISFRACWVIPPEMLERASFAAINFHPGPPEYPGIGCVNFALYEEANTYGVTCHHMEAEVDRGRIIAVQRFAITPDDDVASLLERAYQHQFKQLEAVLAALGDGELPHSDEHWPRRPYTRRELNELSRVTPDMTSDEVRRRVRATTFGRWKPTVEVAGYTFELKATSSVV